MPDYGCWPLWWADGVQVGNIDPATLPLSAATKERLAQWAAVFDSRLDWEDPGHSPEPPAAAVQAFEQEGYLLWRQLRQELAPTYTVSYVYRGTVFSEPEPESRGGAAGGPPPPAGPR